MHTQQILNGVIVVTVVALVAAVGWHRSGQPPAAVSDWDVRRYER
jgi:hypothetical protein